jgi:hypothetical protein
MVTFMATLALNETIDKYLGLQLGLYYVIGSIIGLPNIKPLDSSEDPI